MKITDIKPGQRYRHYKGKSYIVLAVGNNSENLEKMVVYQAEYDDLEFGNKAVWIRPYDLFVSSVEVAGKIMPRFEAI